MITKNCGVCKDKSMLVDAGFDQQLGKFASQFACQNGHEKRIRT